MQSTSAATMSAFGSTQGSAAIGTTVTHASIASPNGLDLQSIHLDFKPDSKEAKDPKEKKTSKEEKPSITPSQARVKNQFNAYIVSAAEAAVRTALAIRKRDEKELDWDDVYKACLAIKKGHNVFASFCLGKTLWEIKENYEQWQRNRPEWLPKIHYFSSSLNESGLTSVSMDQLFDILALSSKSQILALDLKNSSLEEKATQEKYFRCLVRALEFKGTRLTSLDISNRGLEPSHIQMLATSLKVNRQLTALAVAWNCLGDSGAEILAPSLSEGHLQSLNLRRNGIGEKGAKAIAKVLQSPTHSLTELNLGENPLGPNGASAIAELLTSQNNRLITLHLDGNGLEVKGVGFIAEALPSPHTQLRFLDLQGNHLGAEGGRLVAKAFSSDHSTLTELNLSDNRLGIEGGQAIGQALESEHSSLLALHLGSNQLEAKGVEAIAHSFKSKHNRLTRLDLSRNRMGVLGTKALATSLQASDSRIEKLDLDGNDIGPEGAQALAEFLSSAQSSITSLNLAKNRLEAKGTAAIAEALKTGNGRLTELDLAQNQAKEEGAKALGMSLESSHCHLTSLNLSENELGERGGKMIAAAVQSSRNYLTDLNLMDNHLGAEGGKAIARFLSSKYCFLNTLNVSSNKMGTKGGQELGKAIASPDCDLVTLDIRYNDLKPEGENAIAQGIVQVRKNKKVIWVLGIKQLESKIAALMAEEKKATSSSTSTTSSSIGQPLSGFDQKDYQLEGKDIQLEKKIGGGATGAVFQGTYQHSPVAIKVLYLMALSPDYLREFKAEVNSMAKLKHPNIVTFYGYCVSPHYSIVMELMKYSLTDLLQSKEVIGWDTRYKIAQGITAGLIHLHSRGIIYRDLKSFNVLLDEDNRVKLTDFGLARFADQASSVKVQSGGKGMEWRGTMPWMPPEVINFEAWTQASDMYSYGMVLWEIAARQFPYKNKNLFDVATAVLEKNEREVIPEDCEKEHPDFAKLIKQCWERDPNMRPTALQAMDSLKKAIENEPKPSVPVANVMS